MDLSAAMVIARYPDQYSPEARIESRNTLHNHYTRIDGDELARVEGFDPNGTTTRIHATYVPRRRGPSFKVHLTRGPALTSLRMYPGILYRLENGFWKKVAQSKRVRDERTFKSTLEIVWEDGESK
jgi:hypothetical protein